MNLVFVMSVVVLSLVYFFVRFGGTVRLYAQRIRKKRTERKKKKGRSGYTQSNSESKTKQKLYFFDKLWC